MKKIIILSLISTILATGCSVNYHVRKAFDKGYRCEGGGADTIRISTIDSIPYVLRDSIAWEKVVVQKDTIIRYNRSYVPKTRYIERFNLKRFNDSLKHIRTIYADSLQNALRTHKNKLKTDLKQRKVEHDKTFTDSMKFLAVSLFLLLMILIFFKVSKYLNIQE